jgi:hypothetical protein|tara:strand:- start:2448 stop:2888 length:441 start_codon:yes stop_codon:yes gene_type:complete
MSNVDEQLTMTGHLQIRLNDELVRDVPNLVVTAGKGFVATRMIGTGAGVMSHMEVGTGTTDPAAGNTTLESAVSSSRTAFTSSAAVSGAVVTYITAFAAGTGTGALTEAGIFNASSGGTMLCRTEFSVVNKGAADTMTITWTVTVS